MKLSHFATLVEQYNKIKKLGIDCDVKVSNDDNYSTNSTTARLEIAAYRVNTYSELSGALKQSVVVFPNASGVSYYKPDIDEKLIALAYRTAATTAELKLNIKNYKKKISIGKLHDNTLTASVKPHIKFYPEKLMASQQRQLNGLMFAITDDPVEATETIATEQEDKEGNKKTVSTTYTYRILSSEFVLVACVEAAHPLYNFLDKGMVGVVINRVIKDRPCIVLTDMINVDTYLCFWLLGEKADLLSLVPQNNVILNKDAKLTRLKMELAIKDPKFADVNQRYLVIKNLVMKEYETTAHMAALTNMLDGKLKNATFNNIKMTPDSAEYEGLKIIGKDLIKTAKSNAEFDDRTDIYLIGRFYIKQILKELEEEAISREGLVRQEVNRTLYINGLTAVVIRNNQNTRWTVNGFYINIIDVEPVLNQLFCFTEQDKYDTFVESVSEISLKVHQAWAHGLPVKIHSTISSAQYSTPEASFDAPRLRFIKENGKFFLQIDEDNKAPIKLHSFIDKCEVINRKTNDNITYVPEVVTDENGNQVTITTRKRRNHEWCLEQLSEALKESCTTVKRVATGREPGTNKIIWDRQETCHLTEEMIQTIKNLAVEFAAAAIKKSEELLTSTIKKLDVKETNFNGMTGYEVKGSLRSYFIDGANNKVYNRETGKYICIVSPNNHQVMVGKDELVTRLYALKNDAMIVDKVRTLEHG